MPVVLGPIALAIFQAGGPIWLANALVGVGALGSVFTALGNIALSFGISAIVGMLNKPKPVRPEDVQQSLRVAISDRVRIYGQFQTSGNWFFGKSKDGAMHKGLICCEGLLTEVIALKIDETIVTVDGSGVVTAGGSLVGNARFQYRTGLPTETHYPDLAAAFPEYTAAHRGDGCVTIYATQFEVGPNDVTQVFPSLKDTLYRIEGKFTEVWNPVTEVTEWSDNAAAIIRDFMISPSGMRIPLDVVSTPLAQAAWETAFTTAAEPYDLKAGGTEPRYRLWGAYKFSQAPGSVLETMLANCDGRPILTRDGGVAMEIRTAPAPTVLLDKTLIAACVSIAQGMDVRTTANKITAKFLSKFDDYQLVDADPWLNEDSIALRGEIADDTEYAWTPSHSQARRLMKLRAYRLDSEWLMTVNCRLGAIAAFQEPFVTVDYTIGPTRIFGTFEIDTFTWNMGDKGVLRSFTISLRSIDAAAYEWNPLTEEGDAPVTVDVEVDRSIPAVTGFGVSVARRNISGNDVAYAVLAFTRTNPSLSVQVRGKKTADTVWTTTSVPSTDSTIDFLLMDDGIQYEYQVRHVTSTGRGGDWGPVPSIKVTPVADPVAPVALVAFTQTAPAPHLGNAVFSLTTDNDAHVKTVKLYRKAAGVPLDIAVDVALKTFVTVPSATYGYTDGDASRTSIVTNFEFATDASGWTLGTGFAYSAGGVLKTAGVIAGLSQTAIPAIVPGDVIRYSDTISGRTAGTFQQRLSGSVNTNGAVLSGNGQFLGTLTAVTGNTTIAGTANATFDGKIEQKVAYKQTVTCAPQGSWDYYAVPFNGSGIDGPVSGPVNVIIV